MKFLNTTQVKGLGSIFLSYNSKRYYLKNKLQQILNLFNISFKINNHFFEFASKLKSSVEKLHVTFLEKKGRRMKFRNQLTLLLTMPEDAVGELEISVERIPSCMTSGLSILSAEYG